MAQAANASGCKRRRLDSRGPGETLDLDYDSKCNGSKCNGSECNGDTDADGNGYDGDGATEIVEVDLLKTLQFQRLLWLMSWPISARITQALSALSGVQSSLGGAAPPSRVIHAFECDRL